MFYQGLKFKFYRCIYRIFLSVLIFAFIFSPFFDSSYFNHQNKKIGEITGRIIPRVQKAQAIDITDQMILFYNPASASNDTDLPSGWTCISCSGQSYDNYFPVGSTSFGTGGAKTHAADGTLSHSTPSATDDDDTPSGSTASARTHTHSLSVTDSNPSNYSKYARLMMIKYTGSLPLTSLPDNVIAMFDGTPPAGWSLMNGTLADRIIIASNSSDPVNAGSDTHNHTLTWGSLGAASGTVTETDTTSSVLAARNSHTHTAPSGSTTNTLSNVPQHSSLIFATTNGTVTSFTNMIAMFDATPSSLLWDVISGSGGALENNFIEASTSYVAGPGGSNTHTHSNVTSGNSGQSSTNGTPNPGTANNNISISTHTHTITKTMSASDNRPPYKGIIFAKGKPTTTQTHFRWYSEGGTLDSPTLPISAEDIKASGSEALAINSTYRLRLQMANNKTVNTGSDKYRLEMSKAGASCASLATGWNWRTVPLTPVVASDTFDIEATADFTDGASTSANLLTAGATTFTNGYGLDTRATSGFQTIDADNYTEFDWALKPNSNADTSASYCFRAMRIDSGTASVSSDYSKIASASVQAALTTTFTQNDYEWFYNVDDVQPVGSIQGSENTQAEIGTVGVLVRLRMNLTIGAANLSASSQQFKLQHALSAGGPWTDVGTGAWIFKDNSLVSDPANISSALVSTTDVLETYHESNPTSVNPNGANNGQEIEYDWSLDPTNATPGNVYYFQVVKSDGDPLDGYDNYPAIRITVDTSHNGGGGGVSSPPGDSGGSGGGTPQGGGGPDGGSSASGGPGDSGESGGGEPQGGGDFGGGGGASPVMFDWRLWFDRRVLEKYF